MRIVLEPGDAPRYTFLVEESGDKNYLLVAGSPRFDLYEYDKNSVLHFYKQYPMIESDLLDFDWQADPYISYIIEHSKCNTWTARAALIAAKRFMELEENNYER